MGFIDIAIAIRLTYIHPTVNYYADPHAVKELIETPHRIPMERFLMVPLDITTPHGLPFPLYKERVDPRFQNTQAPSQESSKKHITHFTSSFLERTREIMLEFGKDEMELHDIVAVWCAIANPPFPDGEHAFLAEGWHAHFRVFDIEWYVFGSSSNLVALWAA